MNIPDMKKIVPFLRPGHDQYYIRKRVPARYAPVEPRQIVQVCLFTDSQDVARRKAPEVWDQMIEAWEAKLDGKDTEGDARLAAARNLAHRRGYRYLDAVDVAKLPLHDLLERIASIKDSRGRIDMAEADAALGLPSASAIKASEAVDHFYKIAEERVIGKNDDQLRKHRNPRVKATEAFIEAVGDKNLADITAEDMFEFRRVLTGRVKRGEIKASSANKDITHLLALWGPVAASKGFKLQFESKGLRLKEGADDDESRLPFSESWIRDKLLAPGALAGLNKDARLILRGMVNTGARPSEIAGLLPEDIKTDVEIPHIVIRPNDNRTIKNAQSRREIPLVGVSLEAFKEAKGGFPRYAKNSASLSATVNKFLKENGLRETPEHSLYGLRHSLEDRLLRAGVDERIRMDILGHQIKRERYGEGGGLAFVRDQLLKAAL